MKKMILAVTGVICMILAGCQNNAAIPEGTETQKETVSEQSEEADSEGLSGTENFLTAEQAGPYGKITISLPDGWKYSIYPTDSDELRTGIYGIHFYPEEAAEGYIELSYVDTFGVCGTGLAVEETTIAGSPVNIGTYDGHEYWDFISFQGEKEGIVATTFTVEDWWDEYGSQVLEILDTVSFDRKVKEGGVYIYSRESEAEVIGLQFSLKNISRTGATLVFDQYDIDTVSGELTYGDDFVIETKKEGKWTAAQIVLEGDYGFHDIAYTIATENTTESELNWEWLYGELPPGEYRIGKNVMDFRGSGDYDQYMVYACFILN